MTKLIPSSKKQSFAIAKISSRKINENRRSAKRSYKTLLPHGTLNQNHGGHKSQVQKTDSITCIIQEHFIRYKKRGGTFGQH